MASGGWYSGTSTTTGGWITYDNHTTTTSVIGPVYTTREQELMQQVQSLQAGAHAQSTENGRLREIVDQLSKERNVAAAAVNQLREKLDVMTEKLFGARKRIIRRGCNESQKISDGPIRDRQPNRLRGCN